MISRIQVQMNDFHAMKHTHTLIALLNVLPFFFFIQVHEYYNNRNIHIFFISHITDTIK